jgi:predicted aldo/keto reductase-like oxidoreductase
MGLALQDGYPDKVFLMSKIDGRDRRNAEKQIDESLLRLRTDRIDLMQFHEVIRMEDPDLIFAQGGALEAVQRAREKGKVRYVGFTGHKDPLVHLRMLEMAEDQDFRFDAVQMPLNVMDAHFRSFQHNVLPELLERNIAVLGMKAMGAGAVLATGLVKPIECLHYVMSLPVSVVITGIERMEVLHQALEAVRTFSPLSQDQISDVLDRTKPAAQNGKYEGFKTTARYDATALHPEWLGVVRTERA